MNTNIIDHLRRILLNFSYVFLLLVVGTQVANAVEPDNYPTGVSATAANHKRIDLNWTDSTGTNLPTKYRIFCNTTNVFTPPADGSAVNSSTIDSACVDGYGVVNATYGMHVDDDSNPSTDEKDDDGNPGTDTKVPNPSQTKAWNKLNPDTTYYFAIFPYVGSGTNTDFKNSAGYPITSATTDAATPTDHPLTFGAIAVGSTYITVQWTVESDSATIGGSGYVEAVNYLVRSKRVGSAYGLSVASGTPVPDDLSWSPDGGVSVSISHVDGTYVYTQQFTDLSPSTTYKFAIFPYTGTSNYKSSGERTAEVTTNPPNTEVTIPNVAPPIPQYEINLYKEGQGTIVSTNGWFNCGDVCNDKIDEEYTLRFMATAADGYTFEGWSGDCEQLKSKRRSKLAVTNKNSSCTAIFKEIPSYTVTIDKQGSGLGTVTSTNGAIDCGETCVATKIKNKARFLFVAEPTTGHIFTGWEGQCETLRDGMRAKVQVLESDITCTATFEEIPTYSVTIHKTGVGTVTSFDESFNCGDTCVKNKIYSPASYLLKAEPADGHAFTGWTGQCESFVDPIEATIQVIDSNVSCTAMFEAIPANGVIPPLVGYDSAGGFAYPPFWPPNNYADTHYGFPPEEDHPDFGRVRVYNLVNQNNKDYSSFIRLTNISGVEIPYVVATLFHESGETLGVKYAIIAQNLKPQRTLGISMEKLEKLVALEAPWEGNAWLEITAFKNTLRIMHLVRNPDLTLSNMTLVADDRGLFNIPSSTNGLDEAHLLFINREDKFLTNIAGTLYDVKGNVLGEENVRIIPEISTRKVTVLSSKMLEQIFGTKSWQGRAWLKLTSFNPGLEMMAILTHKVSGSIINMSRMAEGALYNLPASNNPDSAFIRMINKTDKPMEVRGALYTVKGQLLGEENTVIAQEIPAYTSLSLSMLNLENIFNVLPWEGRARLVITTPEEGLKLAGAIRSGFSDTITNASYAADTAVYNIPSVTNPGKDQAFVRLINATDAPITVTGILFHMDGHVLGTAGATIAEDVPPQRTVGLSMKNLESIFNVSTWNKRARLYITSPPEGVKLMGMVRSKSNTLTNVSGSEGNVNSE